MRPSELPAELSFDLSDARRAGLKPDSPLLPLERLVASETRRLGRGPWTRELTTAAGLTRAPNNLHRMLRQLVDRGLVRVGGRGRRTQYAHADVPTREADPRVQDPLLVILAVLDAHHDRTGAAMSTPDLQRALAEVLGRPVDRTQLNTWLDALTRPITIGARGSRAPEVVLERRKQGVSRRLRFWSRAGRAATIEDRPTNQSEHVRRALTRAETAFGRPVSTPEFGVWAQALGCTDDERRRVGLPPVSATDREIAEVLRTLPRGKSLHKIALLDDARFGASARPGAIRTVDLTWTAYGGAPRRYAMRAPEPDVDGACDLEDAAFLLRPASELALIAHCQKLAGVTAGSSLLAIADLRRRALRGQLLRVVPPGASPGSWIAGACARVRQWLETADAHLRLVRPTGPSHQHYRGQLTVAALRRHLDAIPALFPEAPELCGGGPVIGPPARVAVVGEVGLVTLGDLGPLLNEGTRVVRRASGAPAQLTRAARRFRNPAPAAKAGTEGWEPYALIDRVDVLTHIVERADLPATAALVALGQAVLGHVLRDETVLRTAISTLRPRERLARQGLVVALGLLGTVPPLVFACPDPADAEALQAYLTAVGFGVEDQADRSWRARAADQYARGPACHVVSAARRRIDAGGRLRVAD